jgi:predicted Na+-dependent transporter
MQAQGNEALALLITVLGSILGVLSTPLFVRALLRSVSEVRVDEVAMIVQLVVQILIPVAIGIMLQRTVTAVKEYATKHKTMLSQVADVSIVMLMWEAISRDQVRHRSSAFGSCFGSPAFTDCVQRLLARRLHQGLNYAIDTPVRCISVF